jgi:HNH endonuclease
MQIPPGWTRDNCEVYRRALRKGRGCEYCALDGRTFDSFKQLGIDHLVPWPVSRNDTCMNKASACWRCNNRKQGFDPLSGEAMPAAPDETWREEMIGRVRMHLEQVYAQEREGYEQMLQHLDDPD